MFYDETATIAARIWWDLRTPTLDILMPILVGLYRAATQLQNVNYIARKSANIVSLSRTIGGSVIDRNGAVAWVPFRDFSTHYALPSSEC